MVGSESECERCGILHEFSDDVWAGGYTEPNGFDVVSSSLLKSLRKSVRRYLSK